MRWEVHIESSEYFDPEAFTEKIKAMVPTARNVAMDSMRFRHAFDYADSSIPVQVEYDFRFET